MADSCLSWVCTAKTRRRLLLGFRHEPTSRLSWKPRLKSWRFEWRLVLGAVGTESKVGFALGVSKGTGVQSQWVFPFFTRTMPPWR